MELHKIISGLSILGREKEQNIIIEEIKNLARGQGGILLVRGKSEYGQKTIIRNIVKTSGIPYFYGCGGNINMPYDILSYSFSHLLNDFRNEFDQTLASVNKLEKSIYKGIVGKATRKFAKSESSLEEKEAMDLYFLFTRYLLKKSSDAPFIFYCEELQWAETSSLDILWFAIKSLTMVSAPVLFILNFDLENQGSITPFHLRNSNIPVIERLRGMKIETKRRTGTRPKDFIQKLQDLENLQTLTFEALENIIIEKVLRKLFGSKLFSEIFVAQICRLSAGSGFFFGEILLYLSRHIVEFRGKKWQFKRKEEDIRFFDDIDYFIHSNLEDMGTETFQELQRVALLHSPITKNDWLDSRTIEKESFEKILERVLQFGILRSWGYKHLLFEHDLHRQILIASTSEEDMKYWHEAIATALTKEHSPTIHMYHWKNSNRPEMSLEFIIKAGIENEKIVDYEVAYFLYEEGARLFPESKEMFLEVMRDMLTKSKEKKREELLDPLLTLLRLYRIAGLVDQGMPIIESESLSLWKKITYDHEPGKTFTDFALLVIFLMKSHKASVRTYDKAETENLTDLLLRELVPGKDYKAKTLFLRTLASFTGNKELSDRLAINLEKWGELISKNKKYDPLAVSLKFLQSFEVYEKLCDHFNAARILHTIVKFCQIHNQNYLMSLLQIEALRLLGENYRDWCYTQKKKDEENNEEYLQRHLQQASQCVAAFIDSARFDLERKKCTWLSVYKLEKTYEFCEEFYLENNLVIDLLNSVRNEWENLQENEDHEKSILIISNKKDLGAASIIAEAAVREKVFPEIEVDAINDTEIILEKMAKHNISFILMTPDSNFSFYKEEDVKPFIASYHKEQNTGWFVREYQEHVQFIIWEKTSAELLFACLRFLDESILRSYV